LPVLQKRQNHFGIHFFQKSDFTFHQLVIPQIQNGQRSGIINHLAAKRTCQGNAQIAFGVLKMGTLGKQERHIFGQPLTEQKVAQGIGEFLSPFTLVPCAQRFHRIAQRYVTMILAATFAGILAREFLQKIIKATVGLIIFFIIVKAHGSYFRIDRCSSGIFRCRRFFPWDRRKQGRVIRGDVFFRIEFFHRVFHGQEISKGKVLEFTIEKMTDNSADANKNSLSTGGQKLPLKTCKNSGSTAAQTCQIAQIQNQLNLVSGHGLVGQFLQRRFVGPTDGSLQRDSKQIIIG